jgi:predicted proteasome-type protease
MTNTDDFIKLAKKHTRYSETGVIQFTTTSGIEAFTQALAEPLEVRIAELEEALQSASDEFEANGIVVISIETALANKSDWLQKHDAEVRNKVLLEAAERLKPFDNGRLVVDVLIRMAEQEVTK